MGIHFLHCVHDNEHTRLHDAIHDTFVAIAWNARFHVGWEQLHAFPLITFNSFRRRIDIMIIKDDILILVDVVIANSMQVDLKPWSCAIQGFATFDATQAKEKNYCN
jgi:hypothetical protein